jgi:hypothetical protein
MKLSTLSSAGLALVAALVATPALAQTTWNFGDGGNCDITGSTGALNCTAGTNNTVRVEGFAAASGSNYVRGTLTNQGGSGLGFTAPGESSGSPQHAIDNSGSHELLLLNFGFNQVVLTGAATGWSQYDTDITLLRWTGGSAGPSLTSTSNMSTSGLVAAGWTLVGSADVDGVANSTGTFGARTASTGLAVTSENSSSWWIISSYFGANSGHLDRGNDYFKLLAVHSTCVSNGNGGDCYTPRGDVPEPGSLALVGLALAGGIVATRRRKQAA